MRRHPLALAALAALFIAAPSCGGGRLGGGTGAGTGTVLTGAGGAGTPASGAAGAGASASGAAGAGTPAGGAGGDCGANASGNGTANAGGGAADPNASGTGGSGAGGTSGGGGLGGDGAPYPACSPDTPGRIDQRRMLLDENGVPIGGPLTVAVAVTAVAGSEITFADAAGNRRWTWSPDIPNLPATRINVGDRFDLIVDAHATASVPASVDCQTVVLARCGTLVAFNSERGTPGCSSLPPLGAWGVSIANAGPVCEHPSTASSCDGFFFFAAQISTGNEAAILAPGQTVDIRGLSVSLREFSGPVDYACSDSIGATVIMAGFRRP